MSKILKTGKGTEKGVQELLEFLLKSGKVKGVFTLARLSDDTIDYSLISDPNGIKNSMPLFPLMPANAGKLLSRLTAKGTLDRPIAAVLRPCELRAFVELVKREQGSLENFLFVSPTCAGVYPMKMNINGDLSKSIPAYWNAAKKGDVSPDVRPTCKACEHFVPYNADMTIALIGTDTKKECQVFLNTDKGEESVQGMENLDISDGKESEAIGSLLAKRSEQKKALYGEINTEALGLPGLVKIFGRCIGCHGCNRVCPICYCILCDFESRDHEYEPSTAEAEMDKRGGIRVPPNTVLYQIGRLTHMGISCVGCGMCTDVCPSDIALSAIFLKVGEEIQKTFDYVPGRNVEEDIPLTKYEKDELTEVED
jgi:formate dehydrogenase subunit beta